MKLREYQSALLNDIRDSWDKGNRLVLGQLPTGGGKTHIFSHLIREEGLRALVLAHRQELITQAAEKIGNDAGIIKSGFEYEPDKPFQVASVQTLVNRLDDVGEFDLIVVDEAHHASANTYSKILNRFPSARVLGVTATPCRLSGRGLADVFDDLVCGPSVMELIADGFLCPFSLYGDDKQMVTKGVRSSRGDYSIKDLAKKNDVIELAGSVVGAYQKHGESGKGIVFAINCEHSRGIANAFNQAGIPAAHLDGNSSSKERLETLSRFASGEIRVVSNVGLFTEGFDLPDIDVVQVARPTRSFALWLQMLGRGLRPAEGKEKAILIDHTDNWVIHGLPSRYRDWDLEKGEKARVLSKTKKTDSGEILEVSIIDVDVDLYQVKEDPMEWVIQIAEEKGHSDYWVVAALLAFGMREEWMDRLYEYTSENRWIQYPAEEQPIMSKKLCCRGIKAGDILVFRALEEKLAPIQKSWGLHKKLNDEFGKAPYNLNVFMSEFKRYSVWCHHLKWQQLKGSLKPDTFEEYQAQVERNEWEISERFEDINCIYNASYFCKALKLRKGSAETVPFAIVCNFLKTSLGWIGRGGTQGSFRYLHDGYIEYIRPEIKQGWSFGQRLRAIYERYEATQKGIAA